VVSYAFFSLAPSGTARQQEDLAMPRRVPPVPPIFTFRVRLRGSTDEDGAKVDDVWREIEVAANQTLADLGEAIPLAFGFTDPHLWSFFLSGKAWDHHSEYALDRSPGPFGEPRARAARRALIGDISFPGVRGTKEFLFLFDYGDEWHFRVKLVRTSDTLPPDVAYPRVVAQYGKAPPQYEGMEDEEEEDDDDAE
jgi:hypothetical protein